MNPYQQHAEKSLEVHYITSELQEMCNKLQTNTPEFKRLTAKLTALQAECSQLRAQMAPEID
jgi:ketopantoate reductase